VAPLGWMVSPLGGIWKFGLFMNIWHLPSRKNEMDAIPLFGGIVTATSHGSYELIHSSPLK